MEFIASWGLLAFTIISFVVAIVLHRRSFFALAKKQHVRLEPNKSMLQVSEHEGVNLQALCHVLAAWHALVPTTPEIWVRIFAENEKHSVLERASRKGRFTAEGTIDQIPLYERVWSIFGGRGPVYCIYLRPRDSGVVPLLIHELALHLWPYLTHQDWNSLFGSQRGHRSREAADFYDTLVRVLRSKESSSR